MSTLMPPNAVEWATRRGMLEVDLFIQPFFKDCYATLSEPVRQTFQDLLKSTDADLFPWLMGHEAAPPEFAALIAQIRAHRLQALA